MARIGSGQIWTGHRWHNSNMRVQNGQTMSRQSRSKQTRPHVVAPATQNYFQNSLEVLKLKTCIPFVSGIIISPPGSRHWLSRLICFWMPHWHGISWPWASGVAVKTQLLASTYRQWLWTGWIFVGRLGGEFLLHCWKCSWSWHRCWDSSKWQWVATESLNRSKFAQRLCLLAFCWTWCYIVAGLNEVFCRNRVGGLKSFLKGQLQQIVAMQL